MSKLKISKTTLLWILASIFITGITSLTSCKGKTQAKKNIIGGGATFPYPLYTEMFKQYKLAHPNYKINYQSIGSGAGRKRIQEKIIEFAGTDAYIQDQDLENIEGEIVHIPTCIGAVVLAYNSAIKGELKLTGKIIADLYLGKITQWNDSQIQNLNPHLVLPPQTIIPIGRADGSGTTKMFSEYLSKVDDTWKSTVGSSKKITWHKKVVAAKGNEGITAQIKNIPYSIGYITLSHASKNELHHAAIKNQQGEFIKANLENVSLAANLRSFPADTRIYIVNTDIKEGYPIAGFTWILFYQEQAYAKRSLTQAKDLKTVLTWMVTAGQQYTKPLYYSPLPAKVQQQALKNINSMTYKGKTF